MDLELINLQKIYMVYIIWEIFTDFWLLFQIGIYKWSNTVLKSWIFRDVFFVVVYYIIL